MFIKGKIITGRQRGRELGFPTINVQAADVSQLSTGVYVGFVTVAGQKYKAAVFIGASETFGEKDVRVEAYLLDFEDGTTHALADKKSVWDLRRLLLSIFRGGFARTRTPIYADIDQKKRVFDELYGEEAVVELVEKIRKVERFDNAEELKEQIGRDCERAREALMKRG